MNKNYVIRCSNDMYFNLYMENDRLVADCFYRKESQNSSKFFAESSESNELTIPLKTFKIFDSIIDQIVIGNKVKEFSADIDENDNIHIVYKLYTNTEITLKYTILRPIHQNISADFDKNFLTLPAIDLKNSLSLSNLDIDNIDNIEIKVIENIPHIFYTNNRIKDNAAASNSGISHNTINSISHNCSAKHLLNLKHFTIENMHVQYKSQEEICCPSYIKPFYIAKKSNSLYILYCKNYQSGDYYIKKISSKKTAAIGVSLPQAYNINFLLTPGSEKSFNDYSTIICFNKIINENFHVMLKYISFNAETNSTFSNNLSTHTHKFSSHKSKQHNLNFAKWSDEILLSHNFANSIKPSLSLINNSIYVSWFESNKIFYVKTDDLHNWSNQIPLSSEIDPKITSGITSDISYNFKIYFKKCNNILYLSNNIHDKNDSISGPFCPFINSLNLNKKPHKTPAKLLLNNNNINNDNGTYNIKNNRNNNIDSFNSYNSNNNNAGINSCTRGNSNNSSNSNSSNYYIDNLQNKIDDFRLSVETLHSQINDYKNNINKLFKTQSKKSRQYQSILNAYDKKISILQLENTSSIAEYNKKIDSLLKIIEEKDLLIKELSNSNQS